MRLIVSDLHRIPPTIFVYYTRKSGEIGEGGDFSSRRYNKHGDFNVIQSTLIHQWILRPTLLLIVRQYRGCYNLQVFANSPLF